MPGLCACNLCLCIPQVHFSSSMFAPSNVAQVTNCGNAKIAAELIKFFIILQSSHQFWQLLWLLLVVKHLTSSAGMPSLLNTMSCPCSASSDAAHSCLHAHDSFVQRHQVGCNQPACQFVCSGTYDLMQRLVEQPSITLSFSLKRRRKV